MQPTRAFSFFHHEGTKSRRGRGRLKDIRTNQPTRRLLSHLHPSCPSRLRGKTGRILTSGYRQLVNGNCGCPIPAAGEGWGRDDRLGNKWRLMRLSDALLPSSILSPLRALRVFVVRTPFATGHWRPGTGRLPHFRRRREVPRAVLTEPWGASQLLRYNGWQWNAACAQHLCPRAVTSVPIVACRWRAQSLL